MRILFLALEWRPIGGLEIYNLHFARALRAAGCEVEAWGVFNQDLVVNDGLAALPLAPPTRVGLSAYHRFFWRDLLCRRLRRALPSFDLVISGHAYTLPSLRRAWQAQAISPPPYWAWTYGMEVWGEVPGPILVGLRYAQCVGTISSFTADELVRNLPGVQPQILYNAVDVSKFKPAVQCSSASLGPAKRLLTVGRVSKDTRYKGYEVVMQALGLLTQRLVMPIEYHIVGTGDYLTPLKEYARRLGLADHVHFHGRVSDDDLLRAYQSCDIFVMPSRLLRGPKGSWTGEGLGFVYIEAAACGKPVIASKEGGAKEAIRDGVSGYAVDPASPDAVAEAAFRVLSDPVLALRMGRAGRSLVLSRFSMERFQCRVTDILRENGF